MEFDFRWMQYKGFGLEILNICFYNFYSREYGGTDKEKNYKEKVFNITILNFSFRIFFYKKFIR